MHQQDTYSSLLGTYQQAKARGEDVMLTLKTKECVETVQLTVSRPAGGPVAWKEERERSAWRTPAPPPSGWRSPILPPSTWRTTASQPPGWRTPARQGSGFWKSPGTGASGGPWLPPTPDLTSRRKSPSRVKRDKLRSEVRNTAWRTKELDFESKEEVNVESVEVSEDILSEPKYIQKPSMPKVLENTRPVENPATVEQPELKVKCESVSEEKKPYPKMSLEWTNPMCENLGNSDTRPYHILVKPNKHLCGGISVGDNHQTFAGMHRPECWENKTPCKDWLPSHDESELIEYNSEDKMLEFRFDYYLTKHEGDTLTFDWPLFHKEAAALCFTSKLKHLQKIL